MRRASHVLAFWQCEAAFEAAAFPPKCTCWKLWLVGVAPHAARCSHRAHANDTRTRPHPHPHPHPHAHKHTPAHMQTQAHARTSARWAQGGSRSSRRSTPASSRPRPARTRSGRSASRTIAATRSAPPAPPAAPGRAALSTRRPGLAHGEERSLHHRSRSPARLRRPAGILARVSRGFIQRFRVSIAVPLRSQIYRTGVYHVRVPCTRYSAVPLRSQIAYTGQAYMVHSLSDTQFFEQ